MSTAFLQELDAALEHHELLKVRIRAADRDSRDAAVAQMTAAMRAVLVSRIGNVATLYRPRKRNPALVLPAPGQSAP